MDISILKKIGLSEKEIKVYLSLLEYGAISIRNLADITEINRGTVYDILKKLQSIGLAAFYHADNKQRFAAESPDKIMLILKNQEEELKKLKNDFSDFIPELKALQGKEETKPTTKFFEGKDGIRTILEDLLESMEEVEKKEYYVYSATHASNDISEAYPNFTKERIKRKIAVKAISLARGGGLSGLDERRWLGTEDESATFILIYDDKAAYISRDLRDLPVGVIIENKDIYNTQKNIFLRLWEFLK